jgi:hypothetical protein
VNDCQQGGDGGTGVAKTAGTQIFAIAYGSPATGYFNWNGDDETDSINNVQLPNRSVKFVLSQYNITTASSLVTSVRARR